MRTRKILLAGILVAVIAGLFPPWVYEFRQEGPDRATVRPGAIAFIFSPPEPEARLHLARMMPGWRDNIRAIPEESSGVSQVKFFSGVRLDTPRLCVEWAVIGLLTFGGLLLAGHFRSFRPGAPEQAEAREGSLSE